MNKVLILDFGSQYTQLIARRIRELKVYCEIHPCTLPLQKIKDFGAKAIILSGGPASVLTRGSPKVDKAIFEWGIPILGICYGMQLMVQLLGGKVISSKKREYGKSTLHHQGVLNELITQAHHQSVVWMSHGDSIDKIPEEFKILGLTENKIIAAIGHHEKNLFALQFHPEVVHSDKGKEILENFLFKIARIVPDWTMENFIETSVKEIQTKVGKQHVILGLSGGVDSSVAAVLLNKALGKKLTCIFVNNGLLRKNEAKRVIEVFKRHYKMHFIYVDAEKKFLKALHKVKDPEKKRKIIGRVFIEVFDKEARKIKNATFLAQGTLYPDVIESVSFKGPSAVIKSHHNVGGLPKKMGLKLVEPFRELFKDEVREIGAQLGVPGDIVNRHPFPGPGLAIRIIGDVTEERLAVLREADAIVIEEMKSTDWYYKVWQAFAVLLPVKSVGVMGDERTYEYTCALRIVNSLDGMTANWADLPHDVLARISNRIINEVSGINRVVYDISSKPPATIEWE